MSRVFGVAGDGRTIGGLHLRFTCGDSGCLSAFNSRSLTLFTVNGRGGARKNGPPVLAARCGPDFSAMRLYQFPLHHIRRSPCDRVSQAVATPIIAVCP